MQSHLPCLIVSPETLFSIRETVEQTPEGIETGVTLFGVRGNSGFTALSAVGPGPNAIHTPVFHQPDADYLNREYKKLREQWPGLEWIGSLHVHPYGMPYLSGHDRNTVERLFGDASLGLTEFVAGIMQRRGQCVAIYPYVIDRDDRSPWLAPLEIVSTQSDVWRNAERTAKRPPQDTNTFSATKIVNSRSWSRLMGSASILASLMRRITTRMRSNQTLKENMNE